MDVQDINAKKEILSKIPSLDAFFYVSITSTDQPKVHTNLLSASHRIDLLLLENPQKFWLHLQGKLSYFIEKKASIVREMVPFQACPLLPPQ